MLYSTLFMERLSSILQNFNTLKNTNSKNAELEVRFGSFNENFFHPNLTPVNYKNILKYYINNKNFTCRYSHNVIYMYGKGTRKLLENVNKNISISSYKNNHKYLQETYNYKPIIIKKIKLEKLDDKKLGIRIALSREDPLSEKDIENRNYTCKIRERYTFTSIDKSYKIDLTKDKILKNDNFSLQLQCEIEYLKVVKNEVVIKDIKFIKSFIV